MCGRGVAVSGGHCPARLVPRCFGGRLRADPVPGIRPCPADVRGPPGVWADMISGAAVSGGRRTLPHAQCGTGRRQSPARRGPRVGPAAGTAVGLARPAGDGTGRGHADRAAAEFEPRPTARADDVIGGRRGFGFAALLIQADDVHAASVGHAECRAQGESADSPAGQHAGRSTGNDEAPAEAGAGPRSSGGERAPEYGELAVHEVVPLGQRQVQAVVGDVFRPQAQPPDEPV